MCGKGCTCFCLFGLHFTLVLLVLGSLCLLALVAENSPFLPPAPTVSGCHLYAANSSRVGCCFQGIQQTCLQRTIQSRSPGTPRPIGNPNAKGLGSPLHHGSSTQSFSRRVCCCMLHAVRTLIAEHLRKCMWCISTLWRHVYSHIGIVGNEWVDALANSGRQAHPLRHLFLRDPSAGRPPISVRTASKR